MPPPEPDCCTDMKILAFDTACGGCSAAVWRDGIVLAQRQEAMKHGQAEALMPMLVAVMAEARLPFTALDRLAVTVGPGSFTGVRVGLAAARGLALAASLPIVGLTTSETFALAVLLGAGPPGTGVILSAVDARRSDVFLQAFCAATHQPLSEIEAVEPGEVPAWLERHALTPEDCRLVGDGADQISGVERVASLSLLPDPVVLARLAAGRTPQDAPPSALYIRPPDVALPRYGGQLRP